MQIGRVTLFLGALGIQVDNEGFASMSRIRMAVSSLVVAILSISTVLVVPNGRKLVVPRAPT
jgi:hypothetical protein